MKRKLFTAAYLLAALGLNAQSNYAVATSTHLVPSGAIHLVFGGGIIDNNGNWADTSGTVWFYEPVTLNGTSASHFNNLTLQHTGDTSVFNSSAIVRNTLTVTAGVLNSNHNVTLRSTAPRDAVVAPVLGNIIGEVIVERYIPASGNRAWRLLAAPIDTTGAPTIYLSWQEGGSVSSGFGTHITQAGGSGISGSFDAGISSTSSIRQYNPVTNTLATPSGTNISIASEPAWFLFVRGDRMINVNSATSSSNTTLRITGSLFTGNKDYAVAAGKFALIGNPYASPIDFAQAYGNSSTSNVQQKFWVWDPKLSTNGGYVVFDGSLGYLPTVTGGSYTGATSIIQSGQGFFVKSSGSAGNLRIQEDDKGGAYRNVFKTTTGNDPMMLIKLNMSDPNAANAYLPADGTITAFNNLYSASVDSNDATKMNNFGPNLALVRSSTNLSVEKRPDATVSDTLFTNVWNLGTGNYQMEVEALNFGSANLTAYLVDQHLNTTTQLSMSGANYYNFSSNSSTASTSGGRFKVVFQNTVPLTNNTIQPDARRVQTEVYVRWTSTSEADLRSYTLERSVTGNGFETVYQTAVSGQGSYQYTDLSAPSTELYYRVKAHEKGGAVSYSPVVKVGALGHRGSVSVQNPIDAERVLVQFTDMVQGSYKMELINSAGQVVFSRSLIHAGGSEVHAVATPALASGVYTLRVSGEAHASSHKLIQQ